MLKSWLQLQTSNTVLSSGHPSLLLLQLHPHLTQCENRQEFLILEVASLDKKQKRLISYTILTATKGPHFSILRIDLRNICNPFTQHIHRDVIAVLVLPVSSLIAGSLHL